MGAINFQDLKENITGFVRESELNQAREIGLMRIFAEPLIGVAGAGDPLYNRLKNEEIIGPHHLSPVEWLDGASSVISYFLPFSREVREANYCDGLPAREWLYGRIEGEAFNEALRCFIVNLLNTAGFQAIAPAIDEDFKVIEKRSNWSERHTAYIAGLGTFGLSKSLITVRGCAGRYGSVITDLTLQPSPRPYQGIYDNCNNCGECIPRCPSGAIKTTGKDVFVCSAYLDNKIKPRYIPRYGCGKCQTRVPCETGIPE